MSYERLLDRRVVKVDDKYMFICLGGSSNCTEFIGNKEVLERVWGLWFSSKPLPESDFIAMGEKNLDNPDRETCISFKGKWLLNKDMPAFFKNGIKSAMTIEEYVAQANAKLLCYVWCSHKDKFEHTTDLKEWISTTADFKEWLNKAENYAKEGYNSYVHIGFVGREPLHIKKPVSETVFNAPFFCKYKNQYVCGYTAHGFSFTKDKTQTLIFNDKAEYDKMMDTINKCYHDDFTIHPASLLQKTGKILPYYIYCNERQYPVKKLTSAHLFYGNIKDSKRFKTAEQAEQFIKERLDGHFSGMTFSVKTADLLESV